MKEKDKRKTILKDKLYGIEVRENLPSWEEFAHKRSVIYENRTIAVKRRKLVLITRYAAAFLLLSGFVFGIYKINSFKIKNNITVNSINTENESIDTIRLSDDSTRSLTYETSDSTVQNIAINNSEKLTPITETISNNYPETKTNIVTVGDKVEISPTLVNDTNPVQDKETSTHTLTFKEDIISSSEIYPIIGPIYITSSKASIPVNKLGTINKETIFNSQETYLSRYLNDEFEYRSKWFYELSTDIQVINKYALINNQTDSYIPKPPLTINIGIYRNLGNRITIGSGIGYESLRSTYIEVGVLTVTQESTVAHYICIPVSLSYKLTNNQIGANIYLTGNMYAKKIIHGQTTKTIIFPSNLYPQGYSSYPITINYDGIMLSSSFGTGIEYNFTPRFGLYAEPYLNYYFYTNDQPLSVSIRAPLSLNIRIATRFKR